MIRKKTPSTKALETTVREYASSSSAHGVSYIFESNRLGLERGFWVLIVGIALIIRYAHKNRLGFVNTTSFHIMSFDRHTFICIHIIITFQHSLYVSDVQWVDGYSNHHNNQHNGVPYQTYWVSFNNNLQSGARKGCHSHGNSTTVWRLLKI